MNQEIVKETFRFNPVGSLGGGFHYSVYGAKPTIVIENVENLLSESMDLLMNANSRFNNNILLEVTAVVIKTTEDYSPSVRMREDDSLGKLETRYETWRVCDVYEVKAMQGPSLDDYLAAFR